MPELKAANLFRIQKRYLRSVHLERDFQDETATDGYVLTDHAKSNLERIVAGLSPFSGQRAWRITGDYGSGKSSFALILANLLSGREGRLPSAVCKTLNPNKAGVASPQLLPVLVTGSREPLNVALLRSLLRAIQGAQHQGFGTVVKRLRLLLNNQAPRLAIDDHTAIKMIEETMSLVELSQKWNGILIILDELGKFLEFAAFHPEQQDIYFLQRLAETAIHARQTPLLIMGLLHQGFSSYADQLSQSAQREWEKIAGRFEELIFDQPLEQITTLIANALNISVKLLPVRLRSQAKSDMQAILDIGWYGATFNRVQMLDNASRIYPLHPTVIPILQKAFSRFGQNERSLFSFLLSSEPFGLQEFAQQQRDDADGFYRIYDLYNYVQTAFGHLLRVQSYRNRWNHIDSLIESFHSSDRTELQLLKIVGMLNLIDSSNLLASEEAILAAMPRGDRASSARQVKLVLKRLQKEKRVLYYRGVAGGFCLWPYTSVNLEKVYEVASKRLPTSLDVSSVIKEYVQTRPVVARRHYIETGNLRHFEVQYIEIPRLDEWRSTVNGSSDGIIIVPLCENENQRRQALEFACSEVLRNCPEALLAVPEPLSSLSGLVLEAQKWQWIAENTPELNVDSYAAEEVSRQTEESRRILQKRIHNYVGLRNFSSQMNLRWFHKGTEIRISDSRELLSFVSDVCDLLFDRAPRIKNELVNRRNISSAAAAARMRLIERIFRFAPNPLLGMSSEKKPPEMSVYLSILQNTGIHRETSEGFAIVEPETRSDVSNIKPALNRVRELLEEAGESRIRISLINDQLKKKPYGIREGILPILIAIFIKANEHDIAFYENGAFMHQIEGNDFQRIIKAPDTFEMQYCKIAGVRTNVFDRLVHVLGLEKRNKQPPNILDVVQPLCCFAAKLPAYARNTTKLSPDAIALRSSLLAAKEPAPLLFSDLPKAIGFTPFVPDDAINDREVAEFAAKLRRTIVELKGTYFDLQDRMKSHIQAVFDLPDNIQEARDLLSSTAETIFVAVTEPSVMSRLYCRIE